MMETTSDTCRQRTPVSRKLLILTLPIYLVLESGCATHNVRFKPTHKCKIPPTKTAVCVNGRIDAAKALFEQAQLVHNTPRQRFVLYKKGMDLLTDQLGSRDYVPIGEVYGGGNARSTIESLKGAFEKKVSRKGGNVILIFDIGVKEVPYVYTTPSYTTTNIYGQSQTHGSAHAYGSAYSSGNYTYGSATATGSARTTGSATAHTTHTPGVTSAGTLRLPYANGLVFRYSEGTEQRWQRIAALPDRQLKEVLPKLEALAQERKLSFDEVLQEGDRLIAEASGSASYGLANQKNRDKGSTIYGPTITSTRHPQPTASSPWNELRVGMDPVRVQHLLGKPGNKWRGARLTSWYYPNVNGGYVMFIDGLVDSWGAPKPVK